MHVAIVGAGSLGRVYGVRLALEAGEAVTFVVRPAQMRDGAMRLERIDGDGRAHALDAPTRSTEVPAHADVVLVCVRGDQLDDALLDLLARGPSVPAVMLTPMMPADYERMRAALGARVVAAMPNVVSYTTEEGITRYWLPHAATTLIEETPTPEPPEPALAELVGALDRAKIASRFALGVHEENPATTIAFMPLAMGLDVAGGIDALLADHALLDRTLHAADEARELASRVGKVASWASLLMKFVGPITLKVGIAIARRRSPEAMRYVEAHFGKKVHAQNVAMAKAMAELAIDKGVPHAALAELAARLEGAVVASS